MFESISFLKTSLPLYFNSVFLDLVKRPLSFDPKLSLYVGDFLQMSEKMFTQLRAESSFLDFVFKCFICDPETDMDAV